MKMKMVKTMWIKMMTMIKTTMTFWRSAVVVYGCKTVAHKKPQASNKENPSCPIKMMTMKMAMVMLMISR